MVVLLGTGSSQSFVLESAWKRTTAFRACDSPLKRITHPRVRGKFDNHEILSATASIRFSVELLRGDQPSASLAVWAYLYPTAPRSTFFCWGEIVGRVLSLARSDSFLEPPQGTPSWVS